MSKHSKHAKISRLGEPNFGSRTDIGRIREHNEDSLVAKNPLYAVFDGMGGHAAGEVASEIASKVVAAHAPEELDADALGQAVIDANLEIIHAAATGTGKKGMGTTCTAAMLMGEDLIIAQVGDSRCYLLHDGRLSQLTRDHSYVADLVEQGAITKDYARIHPDRSKITRALGTDPNMVPDLYELKVSSGDRLLLCSDGLYSMITDDDIEHILNAEAEPQAAADHLVREANEWGGHDNCTVIVVDVLGFSEIKIKRVARKTKVMAAFVSVLLVAILGSAALVFNNWVSNAAYLGECDGKVAIYHGIVMGDVGGRTDNLGEVSDVSMSDLDSSVADRIRKGEITYNSYSEAQALVKSYKQNIEENKKQEEAKKNAASEATTQAQAYNSSSSSASGSTTTTATSASTATSANSAQSSVSTSTGSGQ